MESKVPSPTGHDPDTRNGHKTGLSGLPSCRSEIITFLAKHPQGIYVPWEIAESICRSVDLVRKECSRMSKPGKGSGPVRRIHHGAYIYDPVIKKEDLIDEIIRTGKFSIENISLYRSLSGWGDTPPQPDTLRNTGNDTNRTSPSGPPLPVENGNRTNRTQSGQEPDTGVPREGFPRVMPTGQVINWLRMRNGDENVYFSSNNSGPFPIELLLHLIEELEPMGLGQGEGWRQIRGEALIDNKTYSLECPVTYQASKGLLLKFYNHGAAARLEIASRESIPWADALAVLQEAGARAQGRSAMAKVKEMEKRNEELSNQVRQDHNVLASLSDRYHRDHPHQKGRNARLTE